MREKADSFTTKLPINSDYLEKIVIIRFQENYDMNSGIDRFHVLCFVK